MKLNKFMKINLMTRGEAAIFFGVSPWQIKRWLGKDVIVIDGEIYIKLQKRTRRRK